MTFYEIVRNFIHNEAIRYVILILEIMGTSVITWAAAIAFVKHFQNAFFKKKYDLLTTFLKSLVTGLEFLMAGEILNTILVHSLQELLVLSGVIILRIALTVLIHFDSRSHRLDKDNGAKENHVEESTPQE